MAYFIYYNDGYFDAGDVGFKAVKTKQKASEFIEHRISQVVKEGRDSNINSYTVIKGKECRIMPKVYASKIEILEELEL